MVERYPDEDVYEVGEDIGTLAEDAYKGEVSPEVLQFLIFEEKINEEKYPLSILGLSYKVANDWVKKGLVANDRHETLGEFYDSLKWYRISLLQAAYLHILIALRKYGFSLEKLIKIKKMLLADYPQSSTSNVEFAMLYAGSARVSHNIYLFVNALGDCVLSTQSEFKGRVDGAKFPNYIAINLNVLWKEHFTGPVVHEECAELLSPEESLLIKNVRLTKQGKVAVKLNEGKIKEFEKETEAEADLTQLSSTLKDLLDLSPFCDLNLKCKDGKIVTTKITKKNRV